MQEGPNTVQSTNTEFSLQGLATVLARVGNKSKSWLYKEIRAGRFPAPIPLGSGRAVAWDSRTIDRWINERVAQATGR
jgi:predicted DNA-binding transcriptional regulator AlpA